MIVQPVHKYMVRTVLLSRSGSLSAPGRTGAIMAKVLMPFRVKCGQRLDPFCYRRRPGLEDLPHPLIGRRDGEADLDVGRPLQDIDVPQHER